MKIKIQAAVQQMINDGALFVVNHSGGKDSQAMTAIIRDLVPDSQILVIHSHLPEVEWEGVQEHIEATTQGLELIITQAGKTFFEMVEHRQMFPSPSYRQCTSDLKRDPIEKVIKRLCKERGITQVVNCIGIRADESTSRAKKDPCKINKRLTKAGRTVLEWYPIFELETADVWATIANHGQVPHWAYQAGMTRLSCCFCIMASQSDLTTAARLNPDLYKRVVETEKRINFTLSPCQKGLEEITGIKVAVHSELYNPDNEIPSFLKRVA